MIFNKEIDLCELNKLEKDLVKRYTAISQQLHKNNIEFRKDIRYTTFNTFTSIIESLELYFILRAKCLLENEFWNDIKSLDIFPINDSKFDENIRAIRNDFDAFINIGLYISSFSFIESRFRYLYNYIFDNNEKGKIYWKKSISEIFDKIYSMIIFSDKEYYAFELFRTIRNSLHNNGVFTAPFSGEKKREFPINSCNNNCVYNDQCKKITYDKTGYEFYYNKVPDFGNSMNLLTQMILPDMIKILCKIIKELMNIGTEMTDPFLNSNPPISRR